MTGEPTHTASKQRMVPELMFSSECAPQLSKTAQKCSGHYASLSAMFSPLHSATDKKTVEEVPLQQSSHHNNTTILAPPTASKVQRPLCFAFSYVQPITQCYKRRTVLESSLQSVQSPQKIRTIPVYRRTVGKPCIMLLRINTLSCQQKEMGHKGGQR